MIETEQKMSVPSVSKEQCAIGDNLPFLLLHMEKQPPINVKGNYSEAKQIWEDNVNFCKDNLLLRRAPTLTGTQTQAGRQLDLDRDQD